MVIWLYCIFSNEAAMLPFFLKHYASAVDRLIMLDNCSTDNSRELIRAYPNAIIEDYPAPRAVMDSVNAARFAEMKYHEARGLADYVIWVDCDEFLWTGPLLLREMLRGYQMQGVRAVKASGYQMLSDGFPMAGAAITDQVRYGIRDDEYDKMCVFDPMLNVTWRPGRHSCRIDGNVQIYSGELRLLHYRYLGEEYLIQRNAYIDENRSIAERAARRSYHVASNHGGKYSAAWFQQAQAYATDVVTQNWIGV